MTGDIPCDADAATMKAAIEELESIENVSVSRSGPDANGGYTWTISFLDDVTQVHRGDVNEFVALSSLSGGSGYTPFITIDEFRKGTIQEVQLIKVEAGGSKVDTNSSFKLRFRGKTTNDILALPIGGSTCTGARFARQIITTSTEDTTESGGDYAVSPLTQFSLVYGNRTSSRIFANRKQCNDVSLEIKREIEAMPEFHDIVVTAEDTSDGHGGCKWEVTFNGFKGNPKLFQGEIH